MGALRNHVINVLLLIVVGAGCTDKDRELAKRTGDGSRTFEYKASTPDVPAAVLPEPAKNATTKLPQKGPDSATFRYKPDARGLPSARKSER